MTDFRQKFINEYIKIIEQKYDHLSDKERIDFMIYKNKKKLSPHNYNKLKAIAERCKVMY